MPIDTLKAAKRLQEDESQSPAGLLQWMLASVSGVATVVAAIVSLISDLM